MEEREETVSQVIPDTTRFASSDGYIYHRVNGLWLKFGLETNGTHAQRVADHDRVQREFEQLQEMRRERDRVSAIRAAELASSFRLINPTSSPVPEPVTTVANTLEDMYGVASDGGYLHTPPMTDPSPVRINRFESRDGMTYALNDGVWEPIVQGAGIRSIGEITNTHYRICEEIAALGAIRTETSNSPETLEDRAAGESRAERMYRRNLRNIAEMERRTRADRQRAARELFERESNAPIASPMPEMRVELADPLNERFHWNGEEITPVEILPHCRRAGFLSERILFDNRVWAPPITTNSIPSGAERVRYDSYVWIPLSDETFSDPIHFDEPGSSFLDFALAETKKATAGT